MNHRCPLLGGPTLESRFVESCAVTVSLKFLLTCFLSLQTEAREIPSCSPSAKPSISNAVLPASSGLIRRRPAAAPWPFVAPFDIGRTLHGN